MVRHNTQLKKARTFFKFILFGGFSNMTLDADAGIELIMISIPASAPAKSGSFDAVFTLSLIL